MVSDWVVRRRPHLVLIELAINDGDTLLETEDESSLGSAVEGIVRYVRDALPAAEICMLHMFVRDDLPRAFAASSRPTPVIFQGLPQPATCADPKRPGLFGCPFRTGGGGLVRLADGTLVMSVIVFWVRVSLT